MASKVFREFTIEELDHQYSPSRWVKRILVEKVIEDHVGVVSKGRSPLLLGQQWRQISWSPPAIREPEDSSE